MSSSTTVLSHNLFEIPLIDNHKAGVQQHEKHLECEIAELLHVPHSDFCAPLLVLTRLATLLLAPLIFPFTG